MISHKYKFIFIHIPKTGGTSVEKIFDRKASVRNTRYKHSTLQDLEKLRKVDNSYFKFSFVRNPWDMTVSMYYFLWHKDAKWPNRWRKKNKDLSCLSFKEWILHPSFQGPTIRSIGIGKPFACDGKFSDWLDSENHTMDFVGKFENFQQDFNIVCDNIGIPRQTLPHENQSKHKHYIDYYDDETTEVVGSKYAEEIQKFNYKFGA